MTLLNRACRPAVSFLFIRIETVTEQCAVAQDCRQGITQLVGRVRHALIPDHEERMEPVVATTEPGHILQDFKTATVGQYLATATEEAFLKANIVQGVGINLGGCLDKTVAPGSPKPLVRWLAQ